jgi:hypothetical protein
MKQKNITYKRMVYTAFAGLLFTLAACETAPYPKDTNNTKGAQVTVPSVNEITPAQEGGNGNSGAIMPYSQSATPPAEH